MVQIGLWVIVFGFIVGLVALCVTGVVMAVVKSKKRNKQNESIKNQKSTIEDEVDTDEEVVITLGDKEQFGKNRESGFT